MWPAAIPSYAWPRPSRCTGTFRQHKFVITWPASGQRCDRPFAYGTVGVCCPRSCKTAMRDVSSCSKQVTVKLGWTAKPYASQTTKDVQTTAAFFHPSTLEGLIAHLSQPSPSQLWRSPVSFLPTEPVERPALAKLRAVEVGAVDEYIHCAAQAAARWSVAMAFTVNW